MANEVKFTLEEEVLRDRTSSEQTMFLCVLLQALLDATKPKYKGEPDASVVERDQAAAWFFAYVGVTCENFENTCELAGLEPDTVRDFALKTVTSENVNEIRRKLNSFL